MARPAGDARLIKVLRDDPGRTITARELMFRADIATLHALRTHIVAARRVLGDQAHQLQSVRGAGYRWNAATDQPRPGVPGELVLDLERRTATIDDVHASLTESQAAVLHALTTPPGRVLSAHQLHRHMNVASLAAVKIHVSELRKAVRQLGRVAIVTLRGQGYRYDGPPVRTIRPGRRSTAVRTHVAGDGRVLVDGRPLRLREPEHALLALLLERTGQPVSRGELLARSGLRDIPNLQAAISNTRIALYDSPLHITYSPTPGGYTLTIG